MRWPALPYRGGGPQRPQGPPRGVALEARDVRAVYPDSHALALDGVHLRVPTGARVALVGPNGSGKSTLLKVAAGLLPPLSGEVRVLGEPATPGRWGVAYLPQHEDVDWRFPISVRRLALTGRYVRLGWLRRPGPEDLEAAERALERLGLTRLAERQVGRLSGGQQQRALLARTLAQGAELLLLDEPLNAVDAETREVFSGVLEELRRDGATVVVATHELGRLEAEFDGALYLSEGREVPPPPRGFAGVRLGREGP